ncbi:exo-alpha-sialidase [Paenibacillus koleovorans]|uniref:exo-alpha-sialidase n=1 Tax=Paenibacillus koleovorans TaxID=121608 RepID=UPI000FD982B9|nr:exo-alpha-sialidase [Paenibacillus koleovorans]
MPPIATGVTDYTIQLDTIRSGFVPTQPHCWVHSRVGVVPGKVPKIIVTMQELLLSGMDIFGSLHEMSTSDLGRSWAGPTERAALGLRSTREDVRTGVCDFTPAWHEASGKLLGIGIAKAYKGEEHHPLPYQIAYSAYDADTQQWAEWAVMDAPSEFIVAAAGCTQRVDLQDGHVLLPVYCLKSTSPYFCSTIMKCSFDGKELRYVEHGPELTIARGRGYYEPSLTKYGSDYFLTLRADDHGAVARSKDGQHFTEPQMWSWDDGSMVPTYNTQQHWVTHSNGLFLVYTRKADNNGHVFRHRAPLFMAEVDPNRMCLIRATEKILVPERGARLCNFGVVNVNEEETWITVCEWMQKAGCEQYGSDNSTFAARIIWDRPNDI